MSELMRKLDEQAYTGAARSDYEGSDRNLEGTGKAAAFSNSMRKAAT